MATANQIDPRDLAPETRKQLGKSPAAKFNHGQCRDIRIRRGKKQQPS